MANFVLVHGAWHGGWCYRDTALSLRAAGHTVFTPTHTGSGERAHQASPDVTLDTHIRDVCGVIEAEELDEVILCGHSYGGMVITGVADRLPDSIDALVYLDAFVPQHGDSVVSLLRTALPAEMASSRIDTLRGLAIDDGTVPPAPADYFNVRPENRAWIDRRCVAQSLATFESPLLLRNPEATADVRRVYILAEGWNSDVFPWFAKRYVTARGWQVLSIASGHEMMIDMPSQLAAMLLRLAPIRA